MIHFFLPGTFRALSDLTL
uniref:Uncharacterized protein n=1 Tax=Arundo donax TaxID=35708 RepID=A0A0A8ZLJ1_ARUDO